MGKINVYLPDNLEAEYRAARDRGEIERLSNILQAALEARLREKNPARKLSYEERLRRIEDHLEIGPARCHTPDGT